MRQGRGYDPPTFEIVRRLLAHVGKNACAERLIGSIRTEFIDHIVVFKETPLRHVPLAYKNYYNDARTDLSLNKDAPSLRAAETVGRNLPPDPGLTASSIWPD